MSPLFLLEVVAGFLVIVGLFVVIALNVLATGPKGPQRFKVRMVGPEYFESVASFAASAEITVSAPVEKVWSQVSQGEYLDALPFVSGPRRSGDELTTRTPLLALTETVVRSEQLREFVAIGTGLSVPLTLSSFGERWLFDTEGEHVRVRWTVALTPRWIGWLPLRWTAFAVRPFLKFVLAATIRRIA
jgi:hypothetical protein